MNDHADSRQMRDEKLPIHKQPIAWACVTLLLVGLLGYISLATWSDNSRFYLASSKDGSIVKIDRKSGDTWTFKNGEEVKNHATQELPDYVREAITGKGSYGEDLSGSNSTPYFSGNLYNGSDWHITKVEVLFSNTGSELIGVLRPWGEIKPWEREFRISTSINPKASGSFSVNTGEGNRHEAKKWSIRRAWGYRSEE